MKGGATMAALLRPSSRRVLLRSVCGIGRHVCGERDVEKRWLMGATAKASDAEQAQLLVRRWSQQRAFSSSAELADHQPTVEEDGQSVMEYLQSLGIDVSALEDVELPKLKSIMKERVDYLRNVIGLTINDINDYPLMIGCSVRKNLSPVVQYLLELKVTKSSLAGVVRKYPQVLHSSVAIDLIPNVRYIQGLGVEPKQVGSLLTRYPQVLGYRIEGTMSTSVAYLVMVGVDKRQIGPVLTEKPEIMGMRVSNNLRPKVEFIRSLGIPLLVVGKMIENRPFILDYSVDDKMRPAVDALLALGVRQDALPGMLLQYPELLGIKVKDKVEVKLPWLTAKVGVRREDMAAILEKLPQILAMSVPTGTKRVHALRELGLSKEEVAGMIVVCPQLIGLSIEKRIAPNGSFLVKDMKRDVKELLEFPAFLTYDLETRIRPRFERVLKEKPTSWSLAWMLNCSDAEFEKRVTSSRGVDQLTPVDASFDTVGRLRVHEDVPSDEEPEDKRRITSRQKNSSRDLFRSNQPASISTPRPRPAIKFQDSDRNGPLKQGGYRDAPRAQATRSRPMVDSSDDEVEDENRMSREVGYNNVPPRRSQSSRSRPVVDSFDDEYEMPRRQVYKEDPPREQVTRSRNMLGSSDDEHRVSRQVYSKESPPAQTSSRSRPMVDSSDEDEDQVPRSQLYMMDSSDEGEDQVPRSQLYMLDSSDEDEDQEPRSQLYMMDSSDGEFEDESQMPRQVYKEEDPPRAQASIPRPMADSFDDESRQVHEEEEPPRAQASRPRPMADAFDDESRQVHEEEDRSRSTPRQYMMSSSDEEDYGPPPKQSSSRDPPNSGHPRPIEQVAEPQLPPRKPTTPPRAQPFRPKHVSMMPDSSEDEFEDDYFAPKPTRRGAPPRSTAYSRQRSMTSNKDK